MSHFCKTAMLHKLVKILLVLENFPSVFSFFRGPLCSSWLPGLDVSDQAFVIQGVNFWSKIFDKWRNLTSRYFGNVVEVMVFKQFAEIGRLVNVYRIIIHFMQIFCHKNLHDLHKWIIILKRLFHVRFLANTMTSTTYPKYPLAKIYFWVQIFFTEINMHCGWKNPKIHPSWEPRRTKWLSKEAKDRWKQTEG